MMPPGGENQIDIITSRGGVVVGAGAGGAAPSPNVHSPVTGYKKSLADSTISDAELESQKRKQSSGGYPYYGPPVGEHDAERGALGKGDPGEESSPKRISLDDRINIVLGMNGTTAVDGGKLPPPGKHHHSSMHHHHHHHGHHHGHGPHHAGGYDYPPSAHDMYQQPSSRHPHLPPMNYPGGYGGGQDYQGGPGYGYGPPRGPPGSSPATAIYSYPGSRGPPPSWAPRSHPYQGYPMAFVGPPLNAIRPGTDMYRGAPSSFGVIPPTANATPTGGDSGSTKTQVKQVGNVLEIVPASTPLPATVKTTDGSEPAAPAEEHLPPASSTPGDGQNSTVTTAQPTASSALVTPKILTAEELQQRHERRLELKKKIRSEREKKRLEKSQRKERMQQEIKRLLSSKTIGGTSGSDGGALGGVDSVGGSTSGVAGNGDGGVGGVGVIGSVPGTGSAGSSDEEFEMVKQADLIASLSRSYDKSILKTAKSNGAVGSGTAKKSVLFADGVAPGDESSSSDDETKERSPNKVSVTAKQRKKIRRQRALKLSGKKRLMDRLKQPELDEEAEQLDPELENLPPPPPPPGSPPPELQQPRCLNPPVVRMIDFREGGFGHLAAPPPMHLSGPAPNGSIGGLPPPLPVPPVPMPVPSPVMPIGYRHPVGLAAPPPPHHLLLPSHLGGVAGGGVGVGVPRPASPHGTLPLHHHNHPLAPPHHLYHHPSHGSLIAVPSPHPHAVYPSQTMQLPPPVSASAGASAPVPVNMSPALIAIGAKKRPIDSIISATASSPMVATIVGGNGGGNGGGTAMYDGTPPV